MSDSALILLGLGGAAVVAFVWWLRGFWEDRKATILPRTISSITDGVTDLGRLMAPDPANAAKDQIAKDAVAAHLSALKDAVSKLAP